MKPVILSFFAILLCYSLFFNEKKEKGPAASSSSLNKEARIYLPKHAGNVDSTVIFGLNKFDEIPYIYMMSAKKSM